MTPDSQDTLDGLVTPCLLLDLRRMERNIRRMAENIRGLGSTLRPHVKTHKCGEIAKRVLAEPGTSGITVSTLQEAEYFFEHGVSDILYAVGIAPNKLARVAALMDRGCDLSIVLDDPVMARHVAKTGVQEGRCYRVMIELDTDGHRSGVDPAGESLLEIGHILHASAGTELVGVMAHAGESYFCDSREALLTMARQERDRSVAAAERLRAGGVSCPVVSIGSTPTALASEDLTGVTEVRAGVYVFFDLVMAGIGVCTQDDIAVSVLTSVIGHQRDKGRVITDAGWMAMSRDRGTARQGRDYGYGLVRRRDGSALDTMIVADANQEHGIVKTMDEGQPLPYEDLRLGTLLRVLPNHACATASEFDRYFVVEQERVVAEWERTRGW